jgi:hypothetical protein
VFKRSSVLSCVPSLHKQSYEVYVYYLWLRSRNIALISNYMIQLSILKFDYSFSFYGSQNLILLTMDFVLFHSC